MANYNTNVPQHKLRRLAPRAVQVLERHQDRDPVLGTFKQSLIPAVERFIQLYDSSRTKATSNRDVNEGHEAVAALQKTMRGWQNLVARDVPGFTAMAFDKRAPVPDDVIATAERFIEFVRSTGESKSLPYQAELETAVGGALEVAKKEWSETQTALAAQQARLADTRDAAADLQKELVAFRRTLALTIGTQSRDYRALRSKASVGKDEDEADTIEDGAETVEQDSAVVSPSARTVPPPSNGASNGKNHAVLYASNT